MKYDADVLLHVYECELTHTDPGAINRNLLQQAYTQTGGRHRFHARNVIVSSGLDKEYQAKWFRVRQESDRLGTDCFFWNGCVHAVGAHVPDELQRVFVCAWFKSTCVVG